MRVALVHEFLTQYGGAERVLEALADIWPDAPIYTLYYDRARMAGRFADKTIVESHLSGRWAPAPARHQWYLPFYAGAIEKFDFSQFDLVVSDSSAFAKGVITQPPVRHISYIHTPTRYLWDEQDRATMLRQAPAILRPLVRTQLDRLKHWDYAAAQRPDCLIANSREVADRITRYYHRTADTIIYPPVDMRRFTVSKTHEDYWVLLGRLETYKEPELAIRAATELQLPLKVIGTGRLEAYLRSIAGPTVEFMGWQSDEQVANILSRSQGLIFPPKEDAGLTPLEAMAAGRPVVAYGQGGALETVLPGKTGEFFADLTSKSLVKVLSKFDSSRYDTQEIRQQAERFDIKNFQQKILAMAEKTTVSSS